MLMLFLLLKNMATSEFSWYIKHKPLLLLFCSHNYFSNDKYLHVWCSHILRGIHFIVFIVVEMFGIQTGLLTQ